jgi:hypothetical protein
MRISGILGRSFGLLFVLCAGCGGSGDSPTSSSTAADKLYVIKFPHVTAPSSG